MSEQKKNNKILGNNKMNKFNCPCGSSISMSGKSKHERTLKHQKFLKDGPQAPRTTDRRDYFKQRRMRLKETDDKYLEKEKERKRTFRALKRVEREEKVEVKNQKTSTNVEKGVEDIITSIRKTLEDVKKNPSNNTPALKKKLDKQVKFLTTKVKNWENCEDLKDKLRGNLTPANPNKKTKNKSTTSDQYLTTVKNLYKSIFNQESDCSDFEWLRESDRIIKFMEKKYPNPNTRKTKYSAIAVILGKLQGFGAEADIYSRNSSELHKQLEKEGSKNVSNTKEKLKQVHWNQLLKANQKDLNHKEKAIVGLYTLLPPRRLDAYRFMTILKHTTLEQAKSLSPDLNYLHYSKNDKRTPKHIILNRYKNDDLYGQYIVEIPKQLRQILKTYIQKSKLTSGEFLFTTKSGGFHTNFTTIVSDVFNKLTGRRIGVDALRHMFISNFLSSRRSIHALQEMATAMGHSIGVQKKYDRIDLINDRE